MPGIIWERQRKETLPRLMGTEGEFKDSFLEEVMLDLNLK